MNNDIKYKKQPHNGKTIAGAILLILGCILLVKQLNLWLFPGWLFSWPLFLIIPGLYIGAKSNFQKSNWFVMVLLGFVFLLQEALQSYHVDADGIIWPVAFIAFGVWIILRRNRKTDYSKWQQTEDGGIKEKVNFEQPAATEPLVDYVVNPEAEPVASTEPKGPAATPPPFTVGGKTYTDDYLNTTAVFGGVDKVILSKQFKGGDVVNIFGGTEIDFSKADINGVVIIEVTQVFGATKMIIPPHWHVITDMASIFAGVDDKRMRHAATINNEKVLVIKGVSIFAGIDIRSF